MTLIELIRLLIIIPVVGVGIAALSVLCQTVLPRYTARTRMSAEQMPLRSFIVGLINFTFFGLIAAALGSAGELAGLLALIILTIILSFMAIGGTAIAQIVGVRLRPDNPSELHRLLIGVLVLEVSILAPIVGWFGVPIVAGLIGYGATIIALFRREKPAPAPYPDERSETRPTTPLE
ncbi:MAG: hypothetical protein GFH27_549311n117 [Chloroflexi bacterium AL-W]|nr:hypothetical protein [Chloroflexi bacterium AL-N1]NOK68705.1 hypothetical protein [Chloroflexi bacterium AL-N10]NOK76191.1 hypothetical protein [Chloroflexi bacterium AL-N5]NOK84172.1 hypothetical protein [Chloroflexi bacterium AL-W]NOK91329.1 hypothetical protein [Chloroflexi bacterium AL-N15]